MRVAGVDGCRGGWLVAGSGRVPELHLCATFAEVLELDYQWLAVDMPIGLPELGRPRRADGEARALLGPRRASVFPAPPRPLLQAEHYDQVRGHGMSLQTFYLLPRIRELDAVMNPDRQAFVKETHPELVFSRLAGGPLEFAKKKPAGLALRRQLLGMDEEPWLERFGRRLVARDDILDSLVLLRAAQAQAEGDCRVVPAICELDSKGLKMEICY
ncbi:MAG: DUF429 domain-containing protein [Candidatus Eremiobacteraeota bacterium]|nr:DUF429 domain-containing protein [Candidatus Eremiobacteraeota bacterium]